MPTFQCPDCSNTVSEDATECPSCGMPVSSSLTDDLAFMIGLLTIALAGLAVIIATKDWLIMWAPVLLLITFTAYAGFKAYGRSTKTKRAQDAIKAAKAARPRNEQTLRLEASQDGVIEEVAASRKERAREPVPREQT